MTAEVLGLGEALVGFIARDPGPLHASASFTSAVVGSELNTLTAMARLGVKTAFLGVVGDDPLGDLVRRQVRAEGIDDRHVTVHPSRPTGVLVRDRRGFGASRVTYHRTNSAGAALAPGDLTHGFLDGVRLLHLSGITPCLSPSAADAANAAVAQARAAGVAVSLTLNYRRALGSAAQFRATLRPLVAASRIVVGTREEAMLLSEEPEPAEAAQALLDLGADAVVLTAGAEGAACYRSKAPTLTHRGPTVSAPADTVGAGDAFAGGFLSSWLDGDDMAVALRVAHACAAFCVAAVGDTQGLPDRGELTALLESGDDQIR